VRGTADGRGQGLIYFQAHHRSDKTEEKRLSVPDGQISGQTGNGHRHTDNPHRDHTHDTAVRHHGRQLPLQRHSHGGSGAGHDTGGPLHDGEHCHGGKRRQTGKDRCAGAEHEMHRDAGPCRCTLRGQNRYHHGEPHGSRRIQVGHEGF